MNAPPDRIGRFQVRSPLGKGGMGTLFLAWDPTLERDVAIKVLYRDDDDLRERFLREARSVARLRHPNIVTVFDVGEEDGWPFIAMEYVPGETLGQIIRDRRAVGTRRKIRWIEDVCQGLAYAHDAGIIHRDVKPANLMVGTDGTVKVLDFGVARVDRETQLTQAGSILGTLNYMSPEQVQGGEVDRRSDVFAVGAVLYELLSYRAAFPGSLSDGILHDILHGDPEPLGELVPGVDPTLVSIVERAMVRDRDERYPDLLAMKADLAAAREGLGDVAEPASTYRVEVRGGDDPPEEPVPAERRGRRIGAGITVALVLALIPVGYMILRGDAEADSGTVPPPSARTELTPAAPPLDPASPVDSVEDVPVEPDGPPDTPPDRPPNDSVSARIAEECAQLLERASLGDPLTQPETDFLRENCRG